MIVFKFNTAGIGINKNVKFCHELTQNFALPPNSASLKARVCFIEMTILWMCFRESQNWICPGWQGSSTCLCITSIAQLGAKLCRLWALGLPGKAAPWPALSPFKFHGRNSQVLWVFVTQLSWRKSALDNIRTFLSPPTSTLSRRFPIQHTFTFKTEPPQIDNLTSV